MHPDLSPHLHTAECNILIQKLKDCHEQNTFGRFLGNCNNADNELLKCLRRERENNRKANFEKGKETRAKIFKSMSKD